MKKDHLLKKWLLNDLTDAELEEFKKSEDYKLNIKMIEKVKHFDVPNDLSVKSYDNFKADLKDKNTPVIQLNTYKILFRIAGLFIIGASVYFLFFFNNLTTVQTLASQNITFELPDASSVILNADSKAKYSKKKWADKRQITLDGEAFFKVAKGSKFDVLTSSGVVSVLGTQFSVKNRGNYFEVKCFEGIVSVSSNGKLQQLTKGAIYRILNGIITLDSINTKQPQWIDNISSFKGVPLSEVLDEFERQYGIEIEIIKVNTERIFTGSFVNNNLEQALASITIPFNLTYKKDNSNKIILYKNAQ
jgi:ferric-dicitrate binding protein FerR (iron transport regulator)